MKIIKGNINKFIIVGLATCIVVVGLKASDQSKQIEKLNDTNVEIESLLVGENAAIGYSCGVLSYKLASELLGENKGLDRLYGQGPADTIRRDLASEEKIFWADSCRYEDSTNSNNYVELYVTTFDSKETAEGAFPSFLQIVNDAEELPSENYGQKLVYDGGVFYLLKENKVIQSSASNAGLQNLNTFSREAFESIFANL